MLERDPQMLCDGSGRRNFFPMGDHRFLYPLQIMGIIDVAHEIDVFGQHGNVVVVNG